ncbi:nuclear transport factor 2 family protein [Lentzea albidocapillata]|uniref:SnoaL-like domain-containing protein n=1 Tax=Lentzea albidocapillata TaxID=40571 RepID=A0A1W2DFU6_9PSEU|nr:nuclear transport factor 2 family protein [Lentzea albidocapillata]SMC96333.1 SnoaL-like domain-containing protein [Lentzea albidocapillata]
MVDERDRLGIADLAARYALYVDQRRFGDVADLFTEDGRLCLPDPPDHLDPVRVLTGPKEIRPAMGALIAFPVTLHAIVGHVIEPDATGTVTGVANHVGERGNLVWHLRYQDSYRRESGRWLFVQRSVHVQWIETRPVRGMRQQ